MSPTRRRMNATRGPRPRRRCWSVPPSRCFLFVNLSDEAAQDYFSDGISEDLITALSRLRWFSVIARNSSFSYKGRAVHMKQVAEELGARYVVEGSVRRAGDRVRITVQLNDAAIGRQIWSERYDRDLAHVFAVQDEITEAVVAAIEPQIYAAENFRARRKPPESLDGWDLVMRALSHYWLVTRQDNVAAQALLEQAIAIDPTYGQALGVLAVSLTFGGYMAWVDMPTVLPVAERAARAAIDADRDDPWAHNGMGFVHLLHRRFDDSLAEFEWALRLNPNFSLAQGYYALALSVCGQWQQAEQAADRALNLSPRDPFAAIYCGIAAYTHYVGRNYEAAICFARESIRRRSDFVGAHRVLTAATGITGQRELAAAALAGLRRAQPNAFPGLGSHARCRSAMPPRGRNSSRRIPPRGPRVERASHAGRREGSAVSRACGRRRCPWTAMISACLPRSIRADVVIHVVVGHPRGRQLTLCLPHNGHSATTSPEPPNSAGKSLSFGSPSRMGSTDSA